MPAPAEPFPVPAKMPAVSMDTVKALAKVHSEWSGPAKDFSPPTLDEMGVAEGDVRVLKHPGGEKEALRRMEAFLKDKKRAAEVR